MKKVIVFSFLILLGFPAFEAFAQFPQVRRSRQRIDQAMRTAAQREHDRRLEEASRLPVPRPAVMNVDVQIALSKTEHKTFAEAKAAEAQKIVDGEPLWLYIKFRGKLGDYVLTTRDPEDRERLRYTLFVEVAPRGDITALSQYSIRFTKEELGASEVKVNLAPGLFGRRSTPVFLRASGKVKNGIWNNEFRLTNSVTIPRSLTENLATAPVTLDFSGGHTKYQRMNSDYDSIFLRGSTDRAKMPVAGTFYSERVSSQITDKLAAENIRPLKIYFSGNDWQEFASFGLGMKKSRRIFATFTYRLGENCFYGIAEVVEDFDFLESEFGEAEITFQKNMRVSCADAD